MNDFDFDVLQKKRIARGAIHKRNGSKSRRCSLPSDNMTAAEWKRRNGEVKTYALNVPMSWPDFKSMPYDLQQQYIDNLQNRFNVSISKISTDLWCMCMDGLRRHCERHGLHYQKMPGNRSTDVQWERWLNTDPFEKCDEEPAEPIEKCEGIEDFGVTGDTGEPGVPLLRYHDIVAAHEALMERANEPVEAPDFSPIVEAAHRVGTMLYEPDENDAEAEFYLSNLNVTFTGEFDPQKFVKWLSQFPIPSKNVTIHVNVEVD